MHYFPCLIFLLKIFWCQTIILIKIHCYWRQILANGIKWSLVVLYCDQRFAYFTSFVGASHEIGQCHLKKHWEHGKYWNKSTNNIWYKHIKTKHNKTACISCGTYCAYLLSLQRRHITLRRLKSRATRLQLKWLIHATNKEHIKALYYWTFVRGIPWWPIPLIKGQ